MNIAKNKSKKKLFVSLSLIAAVVIAAGVFAYYRLKPNSASYGTDTSHVNYNYNDPSSDAARKEPIPAKQNPTQDNPPAPPSLADVHITLTQAAQNTDSKQIVVRTIINGISSGTCRAVFSKDGQQSITKIAPVSVQTSYATCQGFNVPVSEFPASGTWKLSLTVEKDDAVSSPVTKDIGVTL